MPSNRLITAGVVGITVVISGCEHRAPSPVAPSAVAAASLDAKPEGGGGGSKLVGDVVAGEYVFAVGDATIIASTCPAPAGNTWGLDFGHTQCLIVRPDWNPESTYDPYELTDDVKLITLQDRSSKIITHVRVLAQDVIGEAGIQHNTDWIPIAIPVAPSRTGGVLHVHAANVEVWRLSGHTGGERVEMIGRISIGDVVYR